MGIIGTFFNYEAIDDVSKNLVRESLRDIGKTGLLLEVKVKGVCHIYRVCLVSSPPSNLNMTECDSRTIRFDSQHVSGNHQLFVRLFVRTWNQKVNLPREESMNDKMVLDFFPVGTHLVTLRHNLHAAAYFKGLSSAAIFKLSFLVLIKYLHVSHAHNVV